MAGRELGARLLWGLHSGALRQTWACALSAASSGLGGALSTRTSDRPVHSGRLGAPHHSLLQRRWYSLPPHTVMTMPSLSPTMTQGNIAAWKKKEGDQVGPGQILAEVETDKATIEWEAQEEGYIAKLLKPDGAKDIPLGTPVAVLVEDAAHISAFKDYTPGAASSGGGAPAPSPSAAAPPPPPPPPAAGSGATFPSHQVLAFPALSPTMSQGNILEWKKKVGDTVAPGDIYCEVETDKATISWEAQEEGYIAQILQPGNAKDIPVGSPAIVLVEEQGDVAAFASYTAADATPGAKPTAAASPSGPAATAAPPPPPTPAAAPAAPAPAPGDRIKASPYAKKLAAEKGVSLAGLAGSGPGGRIVAADVANAKPGAAAAPAAGPAVAVAPEGGYVDIPHTQIRRVTAQRLLESKQTIPHYYLSVEVKVDAMLKLRESINASFGKDPPTKISVNDLVIKAAALALKKVPGVNASWQKDFIRQYEAADISVAVQTPIGLLTPIVKNAHAKGLSAISADVKTLAKKAKDGKLAPAEFVGGTFTISNLGMFGIKQFAAIVNPPQAAILAVGGTDKKVVLTKDGQYVEASVMTVTLSCDHRVIDGAMGAEWLQAFKGYLEAPYTMLL